jgi:hypothetical protein
LLRFLTIKTSEDQTLNPISKCRCQKTVDSSLPWWNSPLFTFSVIGVEASDLRLRYFILESKAERVVKS